MYAQKRNGDLHTNISNGPNTTELTTEENIESNEITEYVNNDNTEYNKDIEDEEVIENNENYQYNRNVEDSEIIESNEERKKVTIEKESFDEKFFTRTEEDKPDENKEGKVNKKRKCEEILTNWPRWLVCAMRACVRHV